MKVLLLNTNDSGGGAAIGAVRLTNALNKAGINATLGVVNKESKRASRVMNDVASMM